MELSTRKKLAVPLYWLAGKFLTWANWVDGPQPRKRKAKAVSVTSIPGATQDEIIAAFGAVEAKRKAE